MFLITKSLTNKVKSTLTVAAAVSLLSFAALPAAGAGIQQPVHRHVRLLVGHRRHHHVERQQGAHPLPRQVRRRRRAARSLDLTLRCASDSYNFELQSNATHSNGAVSGTWSENTRHVGGNIEGSARGNAISVRVSGVISATLGVSTNGNQQSISIQAPGTEMQSVAISMNRSGPQLSAK